MNKVFVGLAILVSLGLVASQALAWGPNYGGCGMWGPRGGYYGDVNPNTADRSFLNDTAKLRKDLAGKEAEYDASKGSVLRLCRARAQRVLARRSHGSLCWRLLLVVMAYWEKV